MTGMSVRVVDKPDVTTSNSFYPSNQPPLLPSPLVKLPLGSVRPSGWLGHQLELMVDGMVGRLSEISKYLGADSIWLSDEDAAMPSNYREYRGAEEVPYWLRGFYELAVLTQDTRLLEESHEWIEAILTSQRGDGYFGPAYLEPAITGHEFDFNAPTIFAGFWSHALMLDVIIHHYEYTRDQRVIPFMTRYFDYCRKVPEDKFIPAGVTIDRRRPCEMIPSIHWLYNHIGETWLLGLAARFFKRFPHMTDSWPGREEMLEAGQNDRRRRYRADEWLSHHAVGFAHRFRYPGSFYPQSRQSWHLAASEYWYKQQMATWGQQPRGIFGGDEVIRSTYTDPRQGCETCAMVELAKSFYILGHITGDSEYADRCEDIMLNHFPASQTPDLKGLHYLTASNQPQLDASPHHEYSNERRMIAYSPHDYRCCQHNVAMGWPWYVGNLWQGTSDNGLATWLYGPSEVTARVGEEGKKISIHADSDYPFKGVVRMGVAASQPSEFPLYLRVPQWCQGFSIAVNGEHQDVSPQAQTYVRIERLWADGDTVDVKMPMDLSMTEWPRTGSVTVDRGPLSYSIRIEEDWRRCGGTDEWPEWEVFPESPWNYGLVLDREHPTESFEVVENAFVADQPWTIEAAPIAIKARAKRVPGWTLENNTVQELRPSPIRSYEPEEVVDLIPLGCARLRMACLPTISDEPHARFWK